MNRFIANALLAVAALCAIGIRPVLASPDYPSAIWNPAASCNYTAGRNTPFTHVAIHTTEGSYAGAISWFKNCSAKVSAHYVMRSSDGQVTQMVREGDRAWHIGTSNGYTVGIEHEGYVANPGTWYTTAMYNASAALTRDILASRSLPRKVYDGSRGWAAVLPDADYNVKGHVNYANQTHDDPGSGWDWRRYKALVDGSSSGGTSGAPGTVKTSGIDLNVRSGPGTSFSIVGTLANGTKVTISCQTTGTTVTGTYGTSNLWNRIGSGRYVPDAYVYTGSDGRVAPNC